MFRKIIEWHGELRELEAKDSRRIRREYREEAAREWVLFAPEWTVEQISRDMPAGLVHAVTR